MLPTRPSRPLGMGFALSLLLQCVGVAAADSGKAPVSPQKGAPHGEDGGTVSTRNPLPPGHPDPNGGVVPAGPLAPSDEDDDAEDDPERLPPGHPGIPPAATDPAQRETPAVFTPPPDTEVDSPDLPAGSINVELRDAENQRIPHEQLTIGILHQSVAKGESRDHRALTTDDAGSARVDGLETGSGVAYRVTAARETATFAAVPFQLSAQHGKHVTLHVYSVSQNIEDSLVVMQGALFVEVKDDRIQIEQMLSVFNLGKVAWVPSDVVIKLPPTFTALSAQQSMSDQGVESLDKVGGRLHGTFAPGKHEIQFRWQLPYSGEKDVEFEEGLPPHMAFMRIMAGGAQKVRLSVGGFPDAQSKADAQGRKVLVTEKQVRRNEPMDSVHVKIDGLPTPGPGRMIAAVLSGFGVLMGLGLAWGGKPPLTASGKGTRGRLLAELFEVEEARRAGDIGPKTYESARRDLLRAVARTLDPEEGGAP
jgi:hypothetical protein